MAQVQVLVTEPVALTADACWAILGRFCAPWHPAIDWMHAEAGGTTRVFGVAGETTHYKERLTWISDSDRCLYYTHLEGIEGATRYDASISVADTGEGTSIVTWQAEIEADAPRAMEIAEGTEAIFRSGIAALSKVVVRDPDPVEAAAKGGDLTEVILTGPPDLAVLRGPDRGGPLHLFLHGIGGQKENWLPQLQALSPFSTVAALDLRGYGGSALGPSPSRVADYCDDIRAVSDTFGARPLVLCGLSYGAWIATTFGLRHPDRVAGLVLAGGCTGMSEAPPAERAAFLASREVPLDAGKTPADFAADVVNVIAGPHADDDIRAALARSMSAIHADTYRDALQCFTTPPERFDFAQIRVPVLMMTGEHDRLAAPQEIRGVSKRIASHAPNPFVRFEEIKGAGHVCNMEAPQPFNRILKAFLDQIA